MKNFSPAWPCAMLLLVAGLAFSNSTRGDEAPRFFGASPGALAKTKALLAAGETSLPPAFKKLLADADKALLAKPASVMDKPNAPASGDKHDYSSTAPYYWPDPARPDGRPYLRRDGQRNPESGGPASDAPRLARLADDAESLALAYHLAGRDTYAEAAARRLRIWFLDPATRMNPNFNHAQAVPGANTGRSTGMIESRSLTRIADATGLLAGSKHWSQADQRGLVEWMRAFLDWAQTSAHGKKEQAAKNNHGTFYAMQIAHFALFTGQTNLARKTIEAARQTRLAEQIQPDGRQPLELARADSFSYSRFNLQAWFALATLGEHIGVELWRFEAAGGASLRRALDFLLPYVEQPDKEWPFEQGRKADRTLAPLLRPAHAIFGDERYRRALDQTPDHERDRQRLLVPR